MNEHLSRNFPLGPIDSESIDDNLFESFFSSENSFFSARPNVNIPIDNPTFIIGRRGSGKTTLLKATKIDGDYAVHVDIKQNEFLEKLIQIINELGNVKSVEKIADLCDVILYENLFYYFCDNASEYPLNTSTFSGYLNFSEGNHKLSKSYKTTEEHKKYLFKECCREVENFLKNNKTKSVLLLDSLDDYDFLFNHPNKKEIISGILKSIGRFNAPNKKVHIRFCLPSEVFPLFESCSSNQAKDFQTLISLSWLPREILHMVAKRLNLGIRKFAPDIYKKRMYFNSSSPVDYIKSFFPETINNSVNLKENTISYIIRHTQLLPRHALAYFGRIISMAISQKKLCLDYPIPDNIIVQSIEQLEGNFANEIICGYRSIYPEAENIFEICIKTLNPQFKYGDLQKLLKRCKPYLLNDDSLGYFLKIFTETGCVGIVQNQTGQYVNGLFRYTSDNPLYFNGDANLCLHPIFTKRFSGLHPSKDAPYAVYPLGSTHEIE